MPDMAPHARLSETSRAAAGAIQPSLPRLQAKVLAFIEAQGAAGATDDEIDLGTGLGGNTVRPRRGELLTRGRIMDSGRTRSTRSGRQATVWVVAR